MFKLYNTLVRKKKIFKPLKEKKAGLYTCGPTVYWFAHIGNLRTYIFEDILRRTLEYNGYKVRHIMNITDVGHLTSDADTGEDKLEKGAKREKKNVWEIAEFYTNAFKKDIKLLNVKEPNVWIKATDAIQDQIELIKILEKKEFTYKIEDGVYFDSSKLKTYGRLWPAKMQIEAGKRVEMVRGKKNPTDFALWKLSPKGVKRQMEWDSPWGKGFPGWHTECVVMSIKELGIPFDIHCGGIDHILIHHTNEIAQAEAVYEKVFARYWMHGEFLNLKEGKMAKSAGNIVVLDDLIKSGINPLSYRYLCLTAHYRSKLDFSWDILKGAENSLSNLYERIIEIKTSNRQRATSNEKLITVASRQSPVASLYQKKFLSFINDDLNMPKAMALMWQIIKNKAFPNPDKYRLILDFDKVFGLGLAKLKAEKIPQEIKKLVKSREEYREENNWQKADEIRKEISKLGYQIEDTKGGTRVKKLTTSS